MLSMLNLDDAPVNSIFKLTWKKKKSKLNPIQAREKINNIDLSYSPVIGWGNACAEIYVEVRPVRGIRVHGLDVDRISDHVVKDVQDLTPHGHLKTNHCQNSFFENGNCKLTVAPSIM